MDFNEAKHSYRTSINDSVGFVGKDHDFFTRVKADAFVQALRTELPAAAHPRVLDIGCGHGFIHRYLLQAGFELAGVDVATEVLQLARQDNPSVRYLGYDGKRLPFDSASFDAALAVCVMHHVEPEEWAAFLGEMKRVVRPGGISVIFEHNPYNLLTRYVVANSELDHDATLLSSRTLRGLMERSGYEQIRTTNILFTPAEHRFFRWLDRQMRWCPLGAQYMMTGRAGAA